MSRMALLAALLLAASVAPGMEFTFEQQPTHADLLGGGKIWLRTMIEPFDEARAEDTYKVYTHIYDFTGENPITKGVGGKYTHHRGLFIGWKDTLVPENGAETDYDTWHMPNCRQQHLEWLPFQSKDGVAKQIQIIRWQDASGGEFIRETRSIGASESEQDVRIIDFESILESKRGTIKLRGDLQHAGMQVRLANEVSEHEATTQYLIPEGAQELEDDKVVGAWWVCCSAEVGGKRYWVMHMTPANHPGGVPVYSIRRYARFGAFFEPDLEEGKPLKLRFRVLVSEHELDASACAALYKAYVEETK